MRKVDVDGGHMISFDSIDIDNVPWVELDQYPDRSVFQTQGWVNFIAEAKGAKPVIAVVKEGEQPVGYFTGLIINKLGLKIIGSPFDGWTTTYMGFNLLPDVEMNQILESLPKFVFNEMGCRVLQISERRFSDLDLANSTYNIINYRNLEIDLTKSEDELFARMTPAKRRNIRKAERSGVVIEESSGVDFAEDYYSQLIEVFGKKTLKPTYSIDRVKSLIKHVYPTGNLLLLKARNPADGRCIASAIFPAFNDTMIFWGGASWREFQYLRPNEYLMWCAMKYWRARGIKIFNLGGWADYKKQYGGEQIKGVILVKSNPAFIANQHNRVKNLWKLYRKFLGRF